MKITQITRTIIEAEEGKLLCRKSDGQVVGEKVHLGYNYYEAGLPLAEAKLETPDDYEEIDKPADYEENPPVINQAKRLMRAAELMEQNKREINNYKFSADEMLKLKKFYPELNKDAGFKVGDEVRKNTKFVFNDKLYAVKKSHTLLSHYEPNENTKELYTEVTEDYKDEIDNELNDIEYEENI